MNFNHIFIAPKNWQSSFDFYTNNLHFEVLSSWGENTTSRGAVLQKGNFKVVIAEEHHSKDDNSWSTGYNSQRPTVHLSVESVDQYFNSLTDKNSAVIPPEDNHWGTRWMVIKDPDDNLIALNTDKS